MSVAARGPRWVVAVSGMQVEARIAAGAGVRAIASAGNPVQLVSALERECAYGAAGIISFGIAGGLGANVASGVWLVADGVVASNARWPVDAAWAASMAARLPGGVRGDIAGTDAIVATSRQKRILGEQSGAQAVDMESHVAAAFAARRGLPFAVFRVIADPLSRAIAPAALQGLRADGSVDAGAVLRALARRPGQLTTLVRNAIDTQIALRALSRGRRLLGPGLGYPDLGQLLIDVT